MKKIVLFSLIGLFSLAGAVAQQDNAADLKRLMTAMQTDKIVEAMMSNMQSAMKQQVSAITKGEQLKEKMDGYMDFVAQETLEMTKKLINEELPAIYEKNFTRDEIRDLIKFYESPIGKKVLEKTPEISAEIMGVTSTKYMPGFQEKMKNKMNELFKQD